MVDVGCGLGSSSRLISKKYNATAQGVTLSPVQVLHPFTTIKLALHVPCAFSLTAHTSTHTFTIPGKRVLKRL